MTKINILLFIPHLGCGGTSRHLYKLCSTLNKDTFNIHIITAEDIPTDEKLYESKLDKRITVSFIPITYSTILKIHTYIKRNHIQIIHSYLYGAHFLDAVIHLISPSKVYITEKRNLQHWRSTPKVSIKEKLRNLVTKVVVANSNEAMRISQEIEKIPDSKYKLIFNGYDAPKTQPSSQNIDLLKQSLSIEPSDFILVVTGSLKPIKNQSELVKALAILIHKFNRKQIKVVLAGSDFFNYMEELKTLAETLNVKDHVIFTGHIDNIESILLCSHLFICTSTTEGFSNSVLESIGSSIPVIATNVGGNKDIIQHGKNGYLYESGNETELAELIESVIKTPYLLETFKKECKKCIQERFTLSKMTAQYTELYLNLINS
jgi:L-malate glycosyltransferase